MKTKHQARINGAAKSPTPQAPKTAGTCVVTVTDTIRQCAEAAGQTIDEYVATAIRQKQEEELTPLLAADSLEGKGLFMNRDGELFLWNEEDDDDKPELTDLDGAVWWWRFRASNQRQFCRMFARADSQAQAFMELVRFHWSELAKAAHAARG